MQKDELRSVVTGLFQNLLDEIDQAENTSKHQVVNYLKEATDIVAELNEEIDSSNEIKSLFANMYKDIARHSLTSYQETNDKFEEIATIHKEAIDSFSVQPINLTTLESKFTEIQSFMSDEIKRTNEVIVSLKERIRTLEKTNNIDPLTKVFNRRALISYLDKICSNKHNTPHDLYILMIDLDDFKNINDTYGHVAGDKILIFLSNMLKKSIRDGDRLFRYGGEEFIIILNRIDKKECQVISSRILEQIRHNNLIYQGQSLGVTVSIGITPFSTEDDPDSFLSRADEAMYSAKNNGKNQIHWM